MPRPDHSAHVFNRLISSSDDGRELYGCTHKRCGETEIRQQGAPSPFAMKRRAKKRAQEAKGGR